MSRGFGVKVPENLERHHRYMHLLQRLDIVHTLYARPRALLGDDKL